MNIESIIAHADALIPQSADTLAACSGMSMDDVNQLFGGRGHPSSNGKVINLATNKNSLTIYLLLVQVAFMCGGHEAQLWSLKDANNHFLP